jgi:hypothetical protein
MGFYVANADDAPGAAAMGLLLLAAGVVLGVRAARNRLPIWAGRTALVAGVVVALFAAALTRSVAAASALFGEPREVPSTVAAPPAAEYAAAVDRARRLARAAVRDGNLPGVSVAVGAGGAVVWAEGFGWRDVGTKSPVTPRTRFAIGSAASAVSEGAVRLGLADTGAEAPQAWSPEQVGEPGEDFPPLAALRHLVLQPLGIAPAEYPIAGDRATFYVPAADGDPRRGRRLMYMRDLACCANGQTSYSTPSDLVRAAIATKTASLDGALAGGTVTSLAAGADGVVVAVSSNITHADTAALARRIAAAFGG